MPLDTILDSLGNFRVETINVHFKTLSNDIYLFALITKKHPFVRFSRTDISLVFDVNAFFLFSSQNWISIVC